MKNTKFKYRYSNLYCQIKIGQSTNYPGLWLWWQPRRWPPRITPLLPSALHLLLNVPVKILLRNKEIIDLAK